ncbi:MAG: hypothetical protein ACC628_20335, partial [Pirellulaceae bacterium]
LQGDLRSGVAAGSETRAERWYRCGGVGDPRRALVSAPHIHQGVRHIFRPTHIVAGNTYPPKNEPDPRHIFRPTRIVAGNTYPPKNEPDPDP